MKKLSIVLSLLLLLGTFTSCYANDNEQGETNDTEVVENQDVEDSKKTDEDENVEEGENLSTGKDALKVPEEFSYIEEDEKVIDVDIEKADYNPSVDEEDVESDLSNVKYAERVKFSDSQIEKLVKNNFLITDPEIFYGGYSYGQIFNIYDENEYSFFPNFITTDSVIHLYHIFYDNFLMDIEENQLLPELRKLSRYMYDSSVHQYDIIEDPEMKALAERNAAFFYVGLTLLEEPMTRDYLPGIELAGEELELIESKGAGRSAILDIPIDYSQMTVRGHYTRSDALESYFKAMMYYGQSGFFVQEEGVLRQDLIGQALLMTEAISKKEEGYELWTNVFDPMNFIVESADDLSVREFAPILYEVYGENPDLNNLIEEEKIDEVLGYIEELPKPEIGDFLGQSFRFMPQRAVIDSTWMQNLVEVSTPEQPSRKPIYTGLEVLAVMGDEEAEKLVKEEPLIKEWPEYEENFERVKDYINKLDDEFWKTNLYRGWMWALTEFTEKFEEGYPKFMQSSDYKVKDWNTALGSYAELKHDTVLYGKQVMAEMGGGYEEEIPKGYVEPNVELYEKLMWLVKFSDVNLDERGFLTENNKESLNKFYDMLEFLRDVSVKELEGTSLSDEDYYRIYTMGGEMESVALKFIDEEAYNWSYLNESDRDMPIVSDLMVVPENTWGMEPGEFLSLGIGSPYPIYVVYEQDGELILGKGGVFSYREFISSERLTDEKWREQLRNGNAPDVFQSLRDIIEGEQPETIMKNSFY